MHSTVTIYWTTQVNSRPQRSATTKATWSPSMHVKPGRWTSRRKTVAISQRPLPYSHHRINCLRSPGSRRPERHRHVPPLLLDPDGTDLSQCGRPMQRPSILSSQHGKAQLQSSCDRAYRSDGRFELLLLLLLRRLL